MPVKYGWSCGSFQEKWAIFQITTHCTMFSNVLLCKGSKVSEAFSKNYIFIHFCIFIYIWFFFKYANHKIEWTISVVRNGNCQWDLSTIIFLVSKFVISFIFLSKVESIIYFFWVMDENILFWNFFLSSGSGVMTF